MAKVTDAMLEGLGAGFSRNDFRHISKHLGEFQELDPELGMKQVVEMGRAIIGDTANKIGARTFEKTMEIGGKNVVVRAIAKTTGGLKSIFVP